MALASSLKNRPFPSDAVAVGEVGLGGEVRGVGHVEERMKEALKMGFERAVVPATNASAAARIMPQVHPVRNLVAAIGSLNQE